MRERARKSAREITSLEIKREGGRGGERQSVCMRESEGVNV